MPDDDLENPDDVVDSSLSGPEARQRKKGIEYANEFIRGLRPVFCYLILMAET